MYKNLLKPVVSIPITIVALILPAIAWVAAVSVNDDARNLGGVEIAYLSIFQILQTWIGWVAVLGLLFAGCIIVLKKSYWVIPIVVLVGSTLYSLLLYLLLRMASGGGG